MRLYGWALSHDGISDFMRRDREFSYLACFVSSRDALSHVMMQQEDPHQMPVPWSWISQPPLLWDKSISILYKLPSLWHSVIAAENKPSYWPYVTSKNMKVAWFLYSSYSFHNCKLNVEECNVKLIFMSHLCRSKIEFSGMVYSKQKQIEVWQNPYCENLTPIWWNCCLPLCKGQPEQWKWVGWKSHWKYKNTHQVGKNLDIFNTLSQGPNLIGDKIN